MWVWGRRAESILAPLVGVADDQTTPLLVTGLAPVSTVCISIGAEPSSFDDQQTVLCLANDGRVWTWSNQSTVLARFLTTTSLPTTPAPVEALSDIIAIGGGPHCAYAVRNDGSTWTWGRNYYAGMGTGSSQADIPTRVVGFGGASQTLSTLGTGSEADSWFLDNFSASELLSSSLVADEGDPDGDGIVNLLEYALGLDPRQQNIAGLPSPRVDQLAPSAQSEDASLSEIALFSVPTADLTSGKRYLALSVNRAGGIRQDIDYFVEVSEDLTNWRSGDPYTITVLDTAEVLEVYSAASLDDVPRQFMRLRVQRREGFVCD